MLSEPKANSSLLTPTQLIRSGGMGVPFMRKENHFLAFTRPIRKDSGFSINCVAYYKIRGKRIN